jgi:PGF-CTERM protein
MKASINKTGLIKVLILFSIIMLSGATPLVSAWELQPNKFAGSVMLNGTDAPVGTVINASIGGEFRGSTVVDSVGEYVQLEVNGDGLDNGTEITFTVKDILADPLAVWIAYAGPRSLDLTAGDAPAGDTTLPDITITSPSSGTSFTNETITVSGTASDNEGLDKVEVKVGYDGDWVAVSGTLTSWSTTVTLDLGQNTIYARANDTSGYSREVQVDDVRYVVGGSEDTTPPTVSIESPISGDTFTTATITVSGKASDNEGVSRVEVKVGSGGWVNASGTTVWSKTVTMSQGLNTINVIAIDTSGNSSETASITVAYNPPSSGSTSGGSTSGGLVVTQGATPTGTNTQPVSGETVISITPTPTTTGTAAPATTLAKEKSGAEPEEKKGLLPGFEAMFAIAGLLAVIYLFRRR